MQLFEAYCAVLEGSIQQVLQAAVPGLSMEEFAAMLVERQGQLGAEVRASCSHAMFSGLQAGRSQLQYLPVVFSALSLVPPVE